MPYFLCLIAIENLVGNGLFHNVVSLIYFHNYDFSV